VGEGSSDRGDRAGIRGSVITGVFTVIAAAVSGGLALAGNVLGPTAQSANRNSEQSTGHPSAGLAPAPSMTSAPVASSPPLLSGVWQGTARQDDSGQLSQYRMTVTLHVGAIGETAGTTHYEVSRGDCYGELTLAKISGDGLSATAYEHITTGGCIPGGTITLTHSPDGRLTFDYAGVTHNGVAESVNASLAQVG